MIVREKFYNVSAPVVQDVHSCIESQPLTASSLYSGVNLVSISHPPNPKPQQPLFFIAHSFCTSASGRVIDINIARRQHTKSNSQTVLARVEHS